MQTVRFGASELRLREPECALSFSPSGSALVAVGAPNGSLSSFSLSPRARHLGPEVAVWAHAGAQIAVAPRASPCRVELLSLPDLSLARSFVMPNEITALLPDPSRGRILIGTSDGRVVRVDTLGRRVVLTRTGRPTALALSPDGERLAIGTDQGLVEVVWIDAVRVLAALTGGRQPVQRLLFTPDGARVIATIGNTARVWPSHGGHGEVFEIGTTSVEVLGFTPKGSVVTVSERERLAVHDLAHKRLAWQARIDGPCALSGGQIFASRLREIEIYDAERGRLCFSTTAPSPLRAIAPIPDSERAICSLVSGTALREVDIPQGAWSGGSDGHEGQIVTVAFGERVSDFVTGGADGRACCWSFDDPSPTLTALAPPAEAVTALAVDAEREVTWIGTSHAVASIDAEGQTVRRSRPLESPVCLVFPVFQTRYILACTESSAASPGELLLLDAQTLEVLHRESVEHSYSRARRRADGAIRLESGSHRALFQPFGAIWLGEDELPSSPPAREARWSIDGSRLVEVANGTDERGQSVAWISLTEMPSGFRIIDGLQTTALSGKIGLSPSGRTLATPHVDGRVRVWDLDRGLCVAEWDAGQPLSAVFVAPDEWRVLGAASDGQLIGMFGREDPRISSDDVLAPISG